MIVLISFILFLFSFSFEASSALDFCVADKAAPIGSNGFSCKNPKKVTVDDFVFSGLDVPANSTNLFKFGFKPVFDAQLPGLNSLGFSIARADFEKGSVVPIHSHPGVSEISFLLEGKVSFGFISSDNTVYQKSLVKGDVFVVPPGLLHFAFNEESFKWLGSSQVVKGAEVTVMSRVRALASAEGKVYFLFLTREITKIPFALLNFADTVLLAISFSDSFSAAQAVEAATEVSRQGRAVAV